VIAAVALLGYAGLLLTIGASSLARAGWPDRAARLAVAAWFALTGSAVASVVLGGLLAACVMEVRARYAYPGAVALAGAGLAVAVIARLSWCAARTLGRAVVARRRHRDGIAVAGRVDPRLGVVVLDHDEPAAWCMPGTRRQVVLTSAAVEVLDPQQLAAVLAHERAHQRGRHHLMISLAGAMTAAFPRVPGFRLAHQQVARLAELMADDAAAAAAPRLTVAGALLALGAPAPAIALGAGGSDTAARVRRLISAPLPLGRAATAGVVLSVAAMLAVPLLLAGPAHAATEDGYCPPAVAAAAAIARVVCLAIDGC
jgi:Peptidase family M48